MRAQTAADAPTRAAEAWRLALMPGALDELPRPLVGAVQGNAFGGGVGLMAVCDTVLAAEHGRFVLTVIWLWLIPATIGPCVIARMDAAQDEARAYLACAPGGVAEARAQARRLGLAIDEAIIGETIAALVRRWESDWAKAGIGAFSPVKSLPGPATGSTSGQSGQAISRSRPERHRAPAHARRSSFLTRHHRIAPRS